MSSFSSSIDYSAFFAGSAAAAAAASQPPFQWQAYSVNSISSSLSTRVRASFGAHLRPIDMDCETSSVKRRKVVDETTPNETADFIMTQNYLLTGLQMRSTGSLNVSTALQFGGSLKSIAQHVMGYAAQDAHSLEREIALIPQGMDPAARIMRLQAIAATQLGSGSAFSSSSSAATSSSSSSSSASPTMSAAERLLKAQASSQVLMPSPSSESAFSSAAAAAAAPVSQGVQTTFSVVNTSFSSSSASSSASFSSAPASPASASHASASSASASHASASPTLSAAQILVQQNQHLLGAVNNIFKTPTGYTIEVLP